MANVLWAHYRRRGDWGASVSGARGGVGQDGGRLPVIGAGDGVELPRGDRPRGGGLAGGLRLLVADLFYCFGDSALPGGLGGCGAVRRARRLAVLALHCGQFPLNRREDRAHRGGELRTEISTINIDADGDGARVRHRTNSPLSH